MIDVKEVQDWRKFAGLRNGRRIKIGADSLHELLDTIERQREVMQQALTALLESYAQPDRVKAEPLTEENRCIRELREYAKANPGTYLWPGWDGNRVTKYLSNGIGVQQEGK